jgi:hypothetical protein
MEKVRLFYKSNLKINNENFNQFIIITSSLNHYSSFIKSHRKEATNTNQSSIV